jgi:hypothetical protein
MILHCLVYELFTWQALVTLGSPGVVDTLEAFTSDPVTVADSIRVHVEVAVTGLALPHRPVATLGVSKKAVTAQVTLRP